MSLREMIYKRRSVRSYAPECVTDETLENIRAFMRGVKPLYPDICVRMEIVEKENIKSVFSWIPQQAIAFFSEEKDGYLENAGFILQQVELYLQTLEIGSCWLGLGKPKSETVKSQENGLSYVVMLVFGYPKEEKDLRRDVTEFKRRSLQEIADREDERLEAARLAPSSINSQPWYFTHEGEEIRVYCIKQGLFKALPIGKLNRIDTGIALAHLYVENTDTFRFWKEVRADEKQEGIYVGTISL